MARLPRRASMAMTVMASLATTATAAPRPFDLQGHRGARGLAPENTLAAFARALTLGVTTLELDLAVTRDGVVVVSHDPVLNPDITRTAPDRWIAQPAPAILSLSRAELSAYDVGRLRPGSAYARQFPDQVPLDGARIPTLAEVYALAKKAGNADVRFNIETKLDPAKPGETPSPDAFVDAVVAAVRASGAAARTTIQSFDWRTLRRVRAVAPEIETVCLTSEGDGDTVQIGRPGASPWLGGLDVDDFGGSVPRAVQAAGGAVWSPNARDISAARVAESHGLGLRVVPWTVNAGEPMRALIDLGVDGIISDRPDLLRTIAAEKGLTLPKGTPVRP